MFESLWHWLVKAWSTNLRHFYRHEMGFSAPIPD